jgi:stage V sporulation protein G
MTNNNLDIRVYPVDEPKGNTLAFASVSIDDLAAIRGVRVVNSVKGPFVAMPQSKDKDGNYHDVAFPLTGDLRKAISSATLEEYGRQSKLSPDQRGYGKPDEGINSGRNADDVKFDVKVYPVSEPQGNTLAFVNAGIDNVMAINGIRIIDGSKGLFVSMPQSKDQGNKYHDIAFPLSGSLRKAISDAAIGRYKQQATEQKQGIGDRLAEGKAQAAQYAANAKPRPAAKKPPGLGIKTA